MTEKNIHLNERTGRLVDVRVSICGQGPAEEGGTQVHCDAWEPGRRNIPDCPNIMFKLLAKQLDGVMVISVNAKTDLSLDFFLFCTQEKNITVKLARLLSQ